MAYYGYNRKLHYPAAITADGKPVGKVLKFGHVCEIFHETACSRSVKTNVTTDRLAVSCANCRRKMIEHGVEVAGANASADTVPAPTISDDLLGTDRALDAILSGK